MKKIEMFFRLLIIIKTALSLQVHTSINFTNSTNGPELQYPEPEPTGESESESEPSSSCS